MALSRLVNMQMLISLLNANANFVIKGCLTTDLQSDNQVTSKCTVCFPLPLANINFTIQDDFLSATYDEYVLFQTRCSCCVLRASYEDHEAVSQDFL